MAWLVAIVLAAPSLAGDLAGKGRAFFNESGCRSCHAVGGVGGDAGPDLTLVGLRRSRRWLDVWLKDPRGWKHDTLMPDFRLREEERRALVEYLAGLRAADFGRRPLGGGRDVFARAGCVACHGPMGRGGHPNNNVPGGAVPPLPELAATYTRAELIARIKRGKTPERADPAGPEPLVAMPAWEGALSEDEIGRVADFVLALAPKEDKAAW
jgi:mono/diheme cytochrome c family protein